MEDLKHFYEILGVRPGASLKEIREAYKCLQEEYYPDYCSKSPQRQEKAREELREIYSAYKKLKVLHKDHPEDLTSEEQNGVSVDDWSAHGESALDQGEELSNDIGQGAYESTPVEDPAPVVVQQTTVSDEKTDAVRILTEKLAASQAEIDRLAAEKESVEKAAEDELAALKAELESVAGGKAQAEKAVAEAMAIAEREAEKSAAEREAAEKRLAAEVAAAKAEAERISEERAAAEQRMSEELAASKALINRLNAEKDSVEKAAEDELTALKAELERTAAAEQAAAEEAAAAKAEVADLATDKTDADKALAEARAAALREAERFAAERVAAAKDFAVQMAAIQGEVDRITAEKTAAEKALNEKLLNARTDFERLSAGKAPAATVPAVEHQAAKAGTELPGSANPTLVKFLRGLAYGGLIAVIGILAYAMVTPHQTANRTSLVRPALKTENTRITAPPPTETKRVVAPVPVVEKRAVPNNPTVKSPVTVSTVVKARPTTHSVKKIRTAASVSGTKSLRTSGGKRFAGTKTAHERSEARSWSNRKHAAMATEIKYKAKPAAVTKPVAKTTTTATPAIKPAAAPKNRQFAAGWRQCVTPRAPKWDSVKDTDTLNANRKYKVDMYPFARY